MCLILLDLDRVSLSFRKTRLRLLYIFFLLKQRSTKVESFPDRYSKFALLFLIKRTFALHNNYQPGNDNLRDVSLQPEFRLLR